MRGSVELASPVDVERSSFIFKAMEKRSRPNCDKNGCKCKKKKESCNTGGKIISYSLYAFSCYAMISRNELIA